MTWHTDYTTPGWVRPTRHMHVCYLSWHTHGSMCLCAGCGQRFIG